MPDPRQRDLGCSPNATRRSYDRGPAYLHPPARASAARVADALLDLYYLDYLDDPAHGAVACAGNPTSSSTSAQSRSVTS